MNLLDLGRRDRVWLIDGEEVCEADIHERWPDDLLEVHGYRFNAHTGTCRRAPHLRIVHFDTPGMAERAAECRAKRRAAAARLFDAAASVADYVRRGGKID